MARIASSNQMRATEFSWAWAEDTNRALTMQLVRRISHVGTFILVFGIARWPDIEWHGPALTLPRDHEQAAEWVPFPGTEHPAMLRTDLGTHRICNGCLCGKGRSSVSVTRAGDGNTAIMPCTLFFCAECPMSPLIINLEFRSSCPSSERSFCFVYLDHSVAPMPAQ